MTEAELIELTGVACLFLCLAFVVFALYAYVREDGTPNRQPTPQRHWQDVR